MNEEAALKSGIKEGADAKVVSEAIIEAPALPVSETVPEAAHEQRESMEQTKEMAQVALALGIWDRLSKDPENKEALVAALRTMVNLGLCAAEIVPFLGEGPTVFADFVKYLKYMKHMGKHFGYFDVTPEVKAKTALMLDGAMLITCGFVKAHWIETAFQVGPDIKKICKPLVKGYRFMRSFLFDRKLKSAHSQVVQAAEVFKKPENKQN